MTFALYDLAVHVKAQPLCMTCVCAVHVKVQSLYAVDLAVKYIYRMFIKYSKDEFTSYCISELNVYASKNSPLDNMFYIKNSFI